MKKILNFFFSMICLICCLFFISVPISFAGEENAFVKTEIKPMDTVYAGQRVPFYVTLYARTRFTGSPRFELPQISNLIFMEIEDRPVLGSIKKNSIEFMAKTHEFAAFPQTDGTFLIPSFTVSFAYVDIGTSKAIESSYKTNEIKIDVTRPPGTQTINRFISTSDFKLRETWDPKPENLKVGDAFKRTIIMTAGDIPGMVFLPVIFKKIKGLGMYENPPRVLDKMERGQFTGKRTDTITYVCEEEGRFKIPAITVYWFDLHKNELKEERLDPVVLTVAPGPQNKNEAVTGDNTKDFLTVISRQTVLIIIGIVLILFAGFRYKKNILGKCNSWKHRQAESEKAFFKVFEKTCRFTDNAKTLQALFNWLDRLLPDTSIISIKGIFKSYHDPELLNVFVSLEKRAYGTLDPAKDTKPRSSRKLLGLVRQYRQCYLKHHCGHKIKKKGLEPLNPCNPIQ